MSNVHMIDASKVVLTVDGRRFEGALIPTAARGKDEVGVGASDPRLVSPTSIHMLDQVRGAASLRCIKAMLQNANGQADGSPSDPPVPRALRTSIDFQR